MKPVTKNYNISNDKLAMMVGDFVNFLNRDFVAVSARGVTQLQIDAFETEGNAFELLQPDEYYRALITIEVDEKNAAREASFAKIQLISGFFEQKWGVGSGQYKTLAIADISTFGEDKYLSRGRNVVTVATANLATLTPLGLTQGDIDDLEADLQLFEDKLHAVRLKVAEREEKTQERILAGNALYEKLKNFSIIGKLVWENVDEAKYNDYIIYKTTSSGLPKVQDLVAEVDPIAPTQVNLSWSPVVGATAYELYSSQVPLGSPAAEFTLTNEVLDPSDTQVVVAGFRYYYKVRAKADAMIGEFSDEVFIES